MVGVIYYTLFFLILLTPVGIYCHLTETNNNNESENNND